MNEIRDEPALAAFLVEELTELCGAERVLLVVEDAHEPNGLAIRTPLGLILHTGDWKIDPDPIIGEDGTAFKALTRGIVTQAFVGDSAHVLWLSLA